MNTVAENPPFVEIHHDADLGGMAYPFLADLPEWTIRTWPLTADIPLTEAPTLRWVKDNKVLDLHVPKMDTDTFLTHTGLRPSLRKGAYVLSKRLSRLMRPYRYWRFFQPSEIQLQFSAGLDGRTWDGCGLISSHLVQQLTHNLPNTAVGERQHRELLETQRFEITVMHNGGQEKGHVLVVDDLSADLLFPTGSSKTELALNGRCFIGLSPIHSRDHMRLDIQSLINLYPFFQPEHLLAWLGIESELFLHRIRSGQLDDLLSRLNRFHTADDLAKLQRWWLGDFLASGGSLMWFPGTIRAMARQHLQRLGTAERKLRFPLPGGRYYIFPADVGERDVPSGYVELDPATATAWVATTDWNDYIVNVLGGCDGDDALWVFPFTDHDHQLKILLWRSPNQLGEYVLLRPTANSHTIQWPTAVGHVTYPHLDSRNLPPRIDTQTHAYGTLLAFSSTQPNISPNTENCLLNTENCLLVMQPAIEQARTNRGVLGAYVNLLMITKALYGRLPAQLPARLEDVIDGSVKDARDLSPVMAWVQHASRAIVHQGKPVPAILQPRLERSLSEKEKRQLCMSEAHWLDTLLRAVAQHRQQFEAEIAVLAAEATPPLAIFTQGHNWVAPGTQLRQAYARVLRASNDSQTAVLVLQEMLDKWPLAQQPSVLLGAAVTCYGQQQSDTLLWQQPTVHLFLESLRQIGVLGEPVWTARGAVCWVREEQQTAVPLQFNATWFNWLRAQGGSWQQMSDVPADVRQHAKQKIAQLAGQWRERVIHTQITDNHRVLAYTDGGNLFGYVQRGQELQAIRASSWQITWATAVDGNIQAIVRAV